MAKKEQHVKKVGGPFLAAAVFCTSVSEDSDGVLSAIRIIDEFRIALPSGTPTDFPSKSKPLEINIFALIVIRRGDARAGKHKLRLVGEQPDGTIQELVAEDIEMPPFPNGTTGVRAKINMKLHSEGVRWIDVILGKERLTRMALNLVIHRADATTEKPT